MCIGLNYADHARESGKPLPKEPLFWFKATTSLIPDGGKIEVPFSDKAVVAKCKTERELKADITELLGKYLRNPQLNLRITDRKSRPPAIISGVFHRAFPWVDLVQPGAALYFHDLIAQQSGPFEFQIGGGRLPLRPGVQPGVLRMPAETSGMKYELRFVVHAAGNEEHL